MDEYTALCRMSARMLTILGYEATYTQDSAEAIALYGNALRTGNAFAVVILDLTMATGQGARDVLACLQPLDPQVQAIVSSGYIDDPVLTQYRLHGFCGALAKPFTMAELAAVVQRSVRH
jgi:CheY-like chemotaxis protein